MIPLYNLHAHNVLTNSIADAGTDAKIAKFFKRGLEIMGLAVLEPVEVYGKYRWDDAWDSLDPAGRGMAAHRTVSRTSNRSGHRASPTGSGIFPNNNGTDLPPVIEVPSSPATPKLPSEKDTGKKLFGGLFNKRKKEAPAPLPLAPTSSRDTTSTENAGPARSSKRHSATPSLSIASPLPTALGFPDTPAADVQLQPQILGLQAVLQSATIPPKGRPSAYVWVLRRWIRGGEEGFLGLGAMVESLGIGSQDKHNPTGMEVEVRFEWKRGAKTKTGAAQAAAKERRRHSISAEGPSSTTAMTTTTTTRTGTMLDPSSAIDAAASPASGSKRLSFQGFGIGKKSQQAATSPNENTHESTSEREYWKLVGRAPSPNPPASITTVGTNEEAGHPSKLTHPAASAATATGESDSESDIEDSERPWNCYLHIRGPPCSRTSSQDELTPLSDSHGDPHGSGGSSSRGRGHGHGHAGRRSEREREQQTLDIRVRIAALAPAPHHPKVIAQIKTPYPLQDVVFDGLKTSAELRMRRADESQTNLVERVWSGAESSGGGGGPRPVVLTREDVKDVVSCTGLWLVVREGYGGLAKKRKGDGWRLRG